MQSQKITKNMSVIYSSFGIVLYVCGHICSFVKGQKVECFRWVEKGLESGVSVIFLGQQIVFILFFLLLSLSPMLIRIPPWTIINLCM